MLKKVRATFSPYVNDFEKAADAFLSSLGSNSDQEQVRKNVVALMQNDAASFLLWCERKLKNYASLTKETRSGMYGNLKAIKSSFQSYSFMQVPDVDQIYFELFEKEINTEKLKDYNKQLQYLKQIMEYFRNQVAYEPKKAQGFGALLKNPKTSQLSGDNHQVAILYAYLYALKFDVSDLQVKITPNRVCLHFEGADIDLVYGTFERYINELYEIMPITEALVLNLLDIPDEVEEAFSVSPKSLAKLAELAQLLSDRTEIVEQNRKVAFRKILLHHLEKQDFEKAMRFAQEAEDTEAIQHVALKAAAFYLKKDDFIEAHKYAKQTKDAEGIAKKIYEKEGISYFNKKNYIRAGEKFKKAGNKEFLKKCYAGLFFQEQAKIKHIKLLSQLKENKKTLLQMKLYAEKSGDQKLVKYIQGLLDQVNGKKKK